MRQELSTYGVPDNWNTSFGPNEGVESDTDDDPFVRDYFKYLLMVEEQMRKSYVTALLAAGMPLDSSMDNPRVISDSLFRYSRGNVRDMLPEVRLPHSLVGVKVFGIPIPSWTRIIIVTPESEVDAWNSYYFVEHLDVQPYAAGLTCVPQYDASMLL